MKTGEMDRFLACLKLRIARAPISDIYIENAYSYLIHACSSFFERNCVVGLLMPLKSLLCKSSTEICLINEIISSAQWIWFTKKIEAASFECKLHELNRGKYENLDAFLVHNQLPSLLAFIMKCLDASYFMIFTDSMIFLFSIAEVVHAITLSVEEGNYSSFNMFSLVQEFISRKCGSIDLYGMPYQFSLSDVEKILEVRSTRNTIYIFFIFSGISS